MTFQYKGEDRTDALDAAVGGESFYALTKQTNGVFAKLLKIFTDYRAEYTTGGKHTVEDGTTRFVSMLEMFNNLLGDTDDDLDDASIAAELYTHHAAAMERITGRASALLFKPVLDAAILAAASSFRQNLAALAASFKLTYRHTDIVALLARTKVVTKSGLVKSRVFETAYILDRILDKKRFLATALLLGIMHVLRFEAHKASGTQRPLYNQGSALFTLLTFSYTPALSIEEESAHARDLEQRFTRVRSSSKTSEDDLLAELGRERISEDWAQEIAARGVTGVEAEVARWKKRQIDNAQILEALQTAEVQYGWKIFGSCLGIDNSLLATTYADAALLWQQFVRPGYPRVVAENSQLPDGRTEMLATFDDALQQKTAWDVADFASFGITLKASALAEMAYVGPVARVVGWYTSSNHAGYTCSVCKTVHGSRVSLVRLWHRCTECKKVYCPQCASGMKLYVAIAIGAAAGAAGGWWWSAASKVYAATFGWLLGSGSSLAASKFLARTCCDKETEPLY